MDDNATENGESGLDLSIIFDAIDIPTILLDADGNVVVWNRASEELMGVEKSEIGHKEWIGEHLYDGNRKMLLAEKVLQHPTDADEVYDLEIADEEYALLQSNQAPTYEDSSTVTAGSGEQIWFLATPLYQDGELVGVLEFIQQYHDSERRRREMGSLIDELEQTLASYQDGEFTERAEYDFAESVLEPDDTEVLDQVNQIARMRKALREQVRETQEAKRELERRNEMLEQFASMISHDLRNPITVAETYVDLAEESGDQEDFDTVRESLGRMSEMIDELLAFARTGGTIEDVEQVELTGIVTEARKIAGLPEDAVTVGFDWVHVDANSEYLLNVFENLFRNAQEHNEGGVSISVDVVVEDGDVQQIIVEDDGEGIPREHRQSIFEYGYTTEEDGIGLGLAIVKNIVTGHGWDISVTGGREGGARFDIDLTNG